MRRQTYFLQLKQIFHMLESLGSARIEGNHTTLADYVDTAVGGQTSATDQLREISNIEKAMTYVEEVVEPGTPLTEHFIRELHAIAVNDLTREGDRTPGIYRARPVTIAKSAHRPPDAVLVAAYMQELTGFVNQDHPRKYDLIKVALAHQVLCRRRWRKTSCPAGQCWSPDHGIKEKAAFEVTEK